MRGKDSEREIFVITYAVGRPPEGLDPVVDTFLHLRFCSHNIQGIPGHYTRAHGVFLSASPDSRDYLFAFVCGVPILRACVRRACSYGLPHPSYAKGRWSAYRFFPWAIYKRHDRILYRLLSAHFYDEQKKKPGFRQFRNPNLTTTCILER